MNRIIVTLLFAAVAAYGQLPYPKTAKTEQADTYHGTVVHDPYRWLEQDTAAAVKQWVQGQNAVTFGYLDRIPFRNAVLERLTKLYNYPKQSAPFRAGKNWFFYKNDGLQNQSVLYIRRGSLDAEPKVFLDPNTFSADGTTSLAGLAFDKQGKYAAYSVSKAGSDWREIFVVDVRTGKRLADRIEWAKFTGVSWYGNGFYYSGYDAPKDTASKLSTSNAYHKVYYHILGTPQAKDMLVYQDKEHPQRLFGVGLTEDQRFIQLSASQRGSNGNALYYRDLRKRTAFLPILETFDDDISIVDNVGDKLLLSTNRSAPNGRVVLFDPARPAEKHWTDVLPERPEVLNAVSVVGGKLIAVYTKDVSHRVYVYDLKGKLENEIPLSSYGTVGGFGGERGDAFTFYTLTSFTSPASVYRYDFASRTSSLYQRTEIDFDPEKYETKQVFYPGKDGTKIPMFIVHKKGLVLDGTNPTLLYGYGGFNVSLMPSFSAIRLAWLEQGGVYAQANLRGGGEYGEQWHQAGMKLNKQNVFDDFIAAGEYLVKERYTSPSRLAVQGGSNGGLLVGAVTNQRPDLFKVALPAVGVMDMLRYHTFTIGWAWVNDYGSSDDSVHFTNLLKYSPVHNIREGVEYPAVLVTTADHDDRVVPAHSFKYISTLQEKYKGPNPVLIRIETSAGHGAGKPTSKILEEWSDIYSFTWWNMGLTPRYLLKE
ncbi:MAG: S9 family peptidase [Bacteroidetes bacterium]|nr:MAG: S9 family peptidase [Bacteroidota bacterium]